MILEPHGWCLLWDWTLIIPIVVSDVFIALAYFAIPVTLWHYTRVTPHLRDSPLAIRVVWSFSLFISLCGLTHVTDIVTIWYPAYNLMMYVRVATAFASILTAILLWPAVSLLFSGQS